MIGPKRRDKEEIMLLKYRPQHQEPVIQLDKENCVNLQFVKGLGNKTKGTLCQLLQNPLTLLNVGLGSNYLHPSFSARITYPPGIVFPKLPDHRNFSGSYKIIHFRLHSRPIKSYFSEEVPEDYIFNKQPGTNGKYQFLEEIDNLRWGIERV